MADQEMRERVAGFRAKRVEAMAKRYLAKGVKPENIHAILGIPPNKIDSSIGAILASQAAQSQAARKPQQATTSSQQPRKLSVANNPSVSSNPSVSAHRLSLAKNQGQPSRYSMNSADVTRPRSKTSGAVSNPKASSAGPSNVGTSKLNNGSLSTIDATNRGKAVHHPTIPRRASTSFNVRRDRMSTVPTQEFGGRETNRTKTINVRPNHEGQHRNQITKRNPSVTIMPTKRSSHLMTPIKTHEQKSMENQVAVREEPPTELNRTFELPSENSVEDLCPKASRSIVTFYVTDYDKDIANMDQERKESADQSEEVPVLKETLAAEEVAVPEEPSTKLNRTFELPSENSVGDACPGGSHSCVTISANDHEKEVPQTDLKPKEDDSHNAEIVALLEETLALQNAMPKARIAEWLERIETRCPKVTKYAQFWVAKSRLVNRKKHAQEAFDIIEEGCLAGAEPLCLLDEETTKIRSLLGFTPDRRDRPRSPRILQEIDSANVFESQLIAYEAKIDKLAGSIASLDLNDAPAKVIATPVRRSARKRSRARWSNHGAIPFEFDADVLDSMYKENINIEIRPNKALFQNDSEV
ncbi:uncharacterized protein LOC136035654 [Artemia franciscana]|uniref:uncharacterized protein LOC136035654 n=1 Tax=Artemia franciscana TaxID=6661 RepID=UPI0032DA4559